MASRDYDRDRYAARHLVENLFCKPKPFRGTATRYDKTKHNFLDGVHRAAAATLLTEDTP